MSLCKSNRLIFPSQSDMSIIRNMYFVSTKLFSWFAPILLIVAYVEDTTLAGFRLYGHTHIDRCIISHTMYEL